MIAIIKNTNTKIRSNDKRYQKYINLPIPKTNKSVHHFQSKDIVDTSDKTIVTITNMIVKTMSLPVIDYILRSITNFKNFYIILSIFLRLMCLNLITYHAYRFH